jgi:hypothetical protein
MNRLPSAATTTSPSQVAWFYIIWAQDRRPADLYGVEVEGKAATINA